MATLCTFCDKEADDITITCIPCGHIYCKTCAVSRDKRGCPLCCKHDHLIYGVYLLPVTIADYLIKSYVFRLIQRFISSFEYLHFLCTAGFIYGLQERGLSYLRRYLGFLVFSLVMTWFVIIVASSLIIVSINEVGTFIDTSYNLSANFNAHFRPDKYSCDELHLLWFMIQVIGEIYNLVVGLSEIVTFAFYDILSCLLKVPILLVASINNLLQHVLYKFANLLLFLKNILLDFLATISTFLSNIMVHTFSILYPVCRITKCVFYFLLFYGALLIGRRLTNRNTENP